MSFLNLTLTAIRGLAANKLRMVLTTLGIIIGVASVIVMLALGNGARAAVAANFRSLGSDAVQIAARKGIKNNEMVDVGKILSYADGLNLPSNVPQVTRVDMQVGGSAKIRYGRNVVDQGFTGVNASDLAAIAASGQIQPVNWPSGKKLTSADFIGQGRFFTDAETMGSAEVAVLGYQTALDLFGGDDPVGRTIWVNHRSYVVIGVIAELEYVDPTERYNRDPNDGLFLPISTAIQQQFTTEPSVSITAHVADESKIDLTKYDIAKYLEKRHGIEPDASGKVEDDFDVTTRNDILGAQLDAAKTFSLLLAAMAVVSLVVGGIGIMNVMLVSVTERTREIGIRLAVGAEQKDIVLQFLLEAILISALGGLFGIAVGVLTIPLAASLNNGVALLAPNSIPLALGVALLVGVGFGLYPAARASQLDPIEALRYE
jgi:putative ABC transport system permease protein